MLRSNNSTADAEGDVVFDRLISNDRTDVAT